MECIHKSTLHLGESPIWDERLQCLYYVDILEKKLYCWNHTLDTTRDFSFKEYISCVALTQDTNCLLVALESGIYAFDISSNTLNFICQPEEKSDYRYNDGSVDAQGCWLLGSMNNINNGPGATLLPDATLYQINGTAVTPLLNEVCISNGIVLQAPYLYFIDSKLNSIRKFSYDKNRLDFQKEIYHLQDGTTLDGMTMSQSEKLYIANWGGSKIIVFDLNIEQVIDTIAVPALNPTSCTFGGPNMNELFITTSNIGDDNTSLAGLYRIQLADAGYPENKTNWTF